MPNRPNVGRIREALAQATPDAEWVVQVGKFSHNYLRLVSGHATDGDARLANLAPLWLAELCDEVERLREKIERTKTVIVHPYSPDYEAELILDVLNDER